jgi:hypothetical protein
MSSVVIEMQCWNVCVSNRQNICRPGSLADTKMEPDHLEPHSDVNNLSFFVNYMAVVKGNYLIVLKFGVWCED